MLLLLFFFIFLSLFSLFSISMVTVPFAELHQVPIVLCPLIEVKQYGHHSHLTRNTRRSLGGALATGGVTSPHPRSTRVPIIRISTVGTRIASTVSRSTSTLPTKGKGWEGTTCQKCRIGTSRNRRRWRPIFHTGRRGGRRRKKTIPPTSTTSTRSRRRKKRTTRRRL